MTSGQHFKAGTETDPKRIAAYWLAFKYPRGCPTKLPIGPDGGNLSIEVPSSQATLVWVKLTEKNQNTFSTGHPVFGLLKAFRI